MSGIRQLARELNLAISTVSRALNDHPGTSEKTKVLVREAAARLGYVANQSGRSLRRGATGAIGFMIETGSQVSGQSDTFFLNVSDGVQSVLAEKGLDLVALLCPSGQDPSDFLRRMVTRDYVDGIILSHIRRVDPRITFLAEQGLPFVTLGRSMTDEGQPWLDLDFDNFAAQSVQRLISRGYTRLAVVVPPPALNVVSLLTEGFRRHLAVGGLALDDAHVLATEPTEQGGYDVARRLVALPHRPDAIVLSNVSHTTGFYRGLAEAGLRPGHDIGVLGFASESSRYLSPRLTAFHQDPRLIGRMLAGALLSSMHKAGHRAESLQAPERKTWTVHLIEGESDPERR